MISECCCNVFPIVLILAQLVIEKRHLCYGFFDGTRRQKKIAQKGKFHLLHKKFKKTELNQLKNNIMEFRASQKNLGLCLKTVKRPADKAVTEINMLGPRRFFAER